jgi:hypothetical protein
MHVQHHLAHAQHGSHTVTDSSDAVLSPTVLHHGVLLPQLQPATSAMPLSDSCPVLMIAYYAFT